MSGGKGPGDPHCDGGEEEVWRGAVVLQQRGVAAVKEGVDVNALPTTKGAGLTKTGGRGADATISFAN